jgi:hypothetical protein
MFEACQTNRFIRGACVAPWNKGGSGQQARRDDIGIAFKLGFARSAQDSEEIKPL